MTFFLIIGGFALAACLAYFSFLNIRQASLLSLPLRLDQLPDRIGGIVCVCGRPEPVEEVFFREAGSGREPVLWSRVEHQERVGAGKHRHWRTVKVIEKKTDFWLSFPDGGKVYVRCRPTEVQDSNKSSSGGGGFGSTRALKEWLNVPRSLTVLGMLEHEGDRAEIREDPKEGLFFSPLPPQRAAAKERTKGWALAAGSAASAIASAAALIFQFAR